MKNTKIIITLGTNSGVGKGITTAAIASLFQANKNKVLALKLNPYLNLDAKFMDPCWYGETFVTQDGKETDIDIAHYERFLQIPQKGFQSISLGELFSKLINSERKNDYDGEVLSYRDLSNVIYKHINEILDREQPEILLIEVGGNINNPSIQPYLIAIKKLITNNANNIVTILLHKFNEKNLNKQIEDSNLIIESLRKFYNWIPDIHLIRSQETFKEPSKTLKSLNIWTSINNKKSSFFMLSNFEAIYRLPKYLYEQKIFLHLLNKFNLKDQVDLTPFLTYEKNFLKWKTLDKKVIKIGLVNKYSNRNHEFYSVKLSLDESALKLGVKVDFVNLSTDKFAKTKDFSVLSKYDGIILPGGYGVSGTEELILAAEYSRINNIPTLGICYGMQIMAISYARNVLNKPTATSSEIAKSPDDFLAVDWIDPVNHTNNIGVKKIKPVSSSKFASLYQKTHLNINNLKEIHRHGFKISKPFIELLTKDQQLKIVAWNDKKIVEAIEIENHPFYIGVQYHPELTTTFGKPHPLYFGFLKTIIETKGDKK